MTRRYSDNQIFSKLTAAMKSKRTGEILQVNTKSERNTVLLLKRMYGWDIRTEADGDGFRVIAA